MRGPRRGIAIPGLADVLEQRRAQAFYELGGDDVGRFGAAANPLAQMVEVEFSGGSGHDLRLRARGALGSSAWSPMAGTAP
jgi:hypothetical protein